MTPRKKVDARPAAVAGGAITNVELISCQGAVLRARKILRPYVAGLFSQGDFTLERIDTCLAEASLRLQELTPKAPPSAEEGT